MDVVTLAMAKAYTDSQRIGYTEPEKVLYWNGDTTNKEAFDASTDIVRISAEYVDLSKVENLMVKIAENQTLETKATYAREYIEDDVYVDCLMSALEPEYPVLVGFPTDIEGFFGIYAVTNYPGYRFESATIPGAVHTIDPKYLPSGVSAIRTIQLTTPVAMDGETQLTAEEGKELDAALEAVCPVSLRLNLDMGDVYNPCALVFNKMGDAFMCYVFEGTTILSLVLMQNEPTMWSVIVSVVVG